MFYPIKNPSQWLLDGLMNEENTGRPCPDCGAKKGQPHHEGCDVARCENTGIQRIQCGCGDQKWDGLWPGTRRAYEEKLVVFDTATSSIMFDLNTVCEREQMEKQKKK